VFRLQPVTLQQEAAVLAFEKVNRAYFAESINDRGDEFFEQYSERHRRLIAEQEARVSSFQVLVDDLGEVVGRFNLYDIVDRTARVGYRVAERVSGRGVATSGLLMLCRTAREDLGLSTLTAVTSNDNVASQRVLIKAGFAYVAPTDVVGGRGMLFDIDLMKL
jgi:[ribosomal protein S5]-alanine N-acetyltransferase